jgi:hypothetical protein
MAKVLHVTALVELVFLSHARDLLDTEQHWLIPVAVVVPLKKHTCHLHITFKDEETVPTLRAPVINKDYSNN